MEEKWAIEIRDQCRVNKVAFFFKQWGGIRPKSGGRLLRGREWNQYPSKPMPKHVVSDKSGFASRTICSFVD